MFAIGVCVIIAGFAIGIKWGLPGVKFNWADNLARFGCLAATVLCAALILLWLWRVLP